MALSTDKMHEQLAQQSQEQWRPVFGYEGYYEVSNLGNVRSVDRVIPRIRPGPLLRKGKPTKQRTNPRLGYIYAHLTKDGVHKNRRVHILVAEAFLGERPKWSTMVNHKDGNRSNNNANNLEWSNGSHNQRHARARYSYKGRMRCVAELAELAGVSPSTMHSRLYVLKWPVERAVSTPVASASR